MAYGYYNDHLKGLTLFIFYGNSYNTAEDLSGSGTNWSFTNYPVSQRGLRLIGTNPSGTGFILNYDLEPLQGTMTTSSSCTSIVANYYNYASTEPVELHLEPASWKPKYQRPRQKQDIFGQYHANVPNFYPSSVNFNIIDRTRTEGTLRFIESAITNAYYFILVDQESARAYEGPLLSDRALAINKGFEPFIPFELLCEYFGDFDPVTETIDWSANKH